MTDIVERLRTYEALDMSSGNAASVEGLMQEAAREIERLRATIAQLRAVAGAVSVEGHSYADIRNKAKRAPAGEPGEPT